MIDPATGEVRLPSADVVLGPRLTRDSFLASRLAEHARPQVVDEPYRSYAVSVPPGEPGGPAFVVLPLFHGPALVSLTLMAIDARFGISWSDWTEEREQDRRRYHDDWLEGTCGIQQGDQRWGRIHSGIDPKGGFSSITLSYR